MTRKQRLYDLMARKQKISLAAMAATTRTTARQSADMTATMDRLGDLLAETKDGLDRVRTKADMIAAHWMGSELACHLDRTRDHVLRLESELVAARAKLAQAEHRCGLYEDRADAARREARDMADARRQADHAPRRNAAAI
ncbi:hypothetical protein ACVDG3_14895 [Meridianimarinicoccus sp. RP-17]|uniref:hypothetical protein n=1 Tax=Meridianimarinicoccus zhengii TaxID=2056810 RepID=UPI000DAC54DE|nr:hypothetical protein [Phycocomes zhengii]